MSTGLTRGFQISASLFAWGELVFNRSTVYVYIYISLSFFGLGEGGLELESHLAFAEDSTPIAQHCGALLAHGF